LKEVNRRLKLL